MLCVLSSYRFIHSFRFIWAIVVALYVRVDVLGPIINTDSTATNRKRTQAWPAEHQQTHTQPQNVVENHMINCVTIKVRWTGFAVCADSGLAQSLNSSDDPQQNTELCTHNLHIWLYLLCVASRVSRSILDYLQAEEHTNTLCVCVPAKYFPRNFFRRNY